MSNQEEFHFDFSRLEEQREAKGGTWLQFLDKSSLYCGVYHLAAGSTDGQQPHKDDEVYYVVSGKAHFEVQGNTVTVGPGSVLFVAAEEEHRFMDIEEDLSVLVFFSKARG